MQTGTRLALLTLLALGAGATAAEAQTGISIKGGASFGNISNKGLLPGSLGTRTGLAGGIALGTSGGIIGFGVEGLYAQRGLRSDQSIGDAETRLDYIDIPAYLRIAAPTPGVSPFAYAGPQVSFEVKCGQANGGPCGASPDRPGTTYAGVIGAGMRFGMLSVEGRYVYGLTDLKLDTITSSESYKHRTFLILVGIGL